MVPEPRSAYALRFFVLVTALLFVTVSCSVTLVRLFPGDITGHPNRFSLAFGVSSILLLCGSASVHQALRAVRRERQAEFRRWLVRGLILGTGFVITQSYAITCLIRRQPPEEVETGAAAFIAVFAAMHAMHFIIAILFLAHITIQTMADRYDHEYFWGVTICAWFWHGLGIAWLVILAVMFLVRVYAAGQ